MFAYARLLGGDPSRAEMPRANLIGANLFKAIVHGADMDGADLSGVRFLESAQLTPARHWHSTSCDDALAC